MVQVSGIVNVILTVALVVMTAGVITTIIIVAQLPVAPVMIASTTECPTANSCIQGILVNNSYCETRPAKASTACDSECFITGATSSHCDPQVQDCVLDDPTECEGYCTITEGLLSEENACGGIFDGMSPFFHANTLANAAIFDRVILGNAYCIAHVCVNPFIFVQLYEEPAVETVNVFSSGATLGCNDFYNTSVKRSCMSSIDFAIENDAVQTYLKSANGYNLAFAFNANMTARFCLTHYSCAPFGKNISFYDTVTKRSVAADPILTPFHTQKDMHMKMKDSPVETRQFLYAAMNAHASKLLRPLEKRSTGTKPQQLKQGDILLLR
jgi:hypothetical protein